MTKLTEKTIEQSLIDQLIGQGYSYYNGTDISTPPRLQRVVNDSAFVTQNVDNSTTS